MQVKDDPRVPALQLLLADVTPEELRALIYAAFPDKLMIMLDHFSEIKLSAVRTSDYINAIANFCDGQTPLGKLAIESVGSLARSARQENTKICRAFGLKA